jgi:imidazolonepropionase-like amidohydrolase
MSRVLLAVVLTAVLGRAATAQPPDALWAINGATLINGTGAPALAAAVILGRGARIVCVGSRQDCPIAPGTLVIEAAGKWVIPGLIDTHVHLDWARRPDDMRRAQLTRFAFGVTTTRDAGTPRNLSESLAARRRSGDPGVPEPRLVVSALVTRGDLQQRTGGNMADVVRGLAERGADAIKIKEERTDDEIHAVVSEAHALGLPVFGHTWWRQSRLDAALAAGIDGLSHMATISAYSPRADLKRPPAPDGIQFWVWSKESWNEQDDTRQQSAIQRMVDRGVWFEPMLINEQHFTFPYPLTDDESYLGEIPTLRALVRPWIPAGESGWPKASRRRERLAAVYERMCQFVGRFHARGGVVVTGTDDDQPGPALSEEVRLLTRCGLSPMSGLQAATQHAAVALNRADIGTVENGKLADLVILDADPLADPINLKRIWRVVKGGHVYDPQVLLEPIVKAYRRQLRRTYATRLLTAGGVLLAIGAIVAIRRRF